VISRYEKAAVIFYGYDVASTKDMTNLRLVGEDTDLLILLLYHTKSHGFDLYLASEPKKNKLKMSNMGHQES